MTEFRITKYDPQYRVESGAYSRHEWTSICDVGKTYDGVVLTYADYAEGELRYVRAIQTLMDAAGARSLTVTDLQEEVPIAAIPEDIVTPNLARLRAITDALEVRGNDLACVARLALREKLWCRLEGDDGFYVHFGYDYCMYIGGTGLGPVAPAMPPALFVEGFESPYHRNAHES